MQSCGVTVAQVILVHFVEVRILTGLPFFCPPQTLEFKAHFPSRPAGDWGTFGAQMGHNRGFAGVP